MSYLFFNKKYCFKGVKLRKNMFVNEIFNEIDIISEKNFKDCLPPPKKKKNCGRKARQI